MNINKTCGNTLIDFTMINVLTFTEDKKSNTLGSEKYI